MWKAGQLPVPAEQLPTGTIIVKEIKAPAHGVGLYARVSSSEQRKVLVEGLSTDPSGACSAWAVASRIRGKHTGVSVCPDVVCYLTLHGATQHANRFQSCSANVVA